MILPMLFAAAFAAQEAPAATPPPVEAQSEAASPAAADASLQAGLKAFRRRLYNVAEIEFRKAADADPSSAAAAFYLGYTYYKMAEPKRPFHPDKKRAAELFAKAYELDPAFKPAWSRK